MDEAITAFEHAVELDRGHEDAWFQLGYLYAIHKRNHTRAVWIQEVCGVGSIWVRSTLSRATERAWWK